MVADKWCENCHAYLGRGKIRRCPRCLSKDIETTQETLKKPYYLNDCNCGQTSICKVCRSKYQRKLRDNYTDEDRKQLNEVAKLQYANSTPKQMERIKYRHKKYFKKLTPEQLQKRREYQKKRYYASKQESKQ